MENFNFGTRIGLFMTGFALFMMVVMSLFNKAIPNVIVGLFTVGFVGSLTYSIIQ